MHGCGKFQKPRKHTTSPHPTHMLTTSWTWPWLSPTMMALHSGSIVSCGVAGGAGKAEDAAQQLIGCNERNEGLHTH